MTIPADGDPAGTFAFYGKDAPNGLGTIWADSAMRSIIAPYVTAVPRSPWLDPKFRHVYAPQCDCPTASFAAAGRQFRRLDGWRRIHTRLNVLGRSRLSRSTWSWAPAPSVSSSATTVTAGSDAFGDLNLQSTSNSVSADVFRVGFNYRSAPMRHPSRSQRSQPPWLRHPASAAPAPAAAGAGSTVPGHAARGRSRSVRLPMRYRAGGPFRDDFGGLTDQDTALLGSAVVDLTRLNS